MLTSSFSKLFSTLAERSLGSQGFLMENHYPLPSSAFWLPAKRNVRRHAASATWALHRPQHQQLRDGFRGWISAALASGPLESRPGFTSRDISTFFDSFRFNEPLGPKVRNTVFVLLFLWSVKLVQIKSNWTQKKLLAEIVGKHRLINSLWFIYPPSQTFSSFLVDAPLF